MRQIKNKKEQEVIKMPQNTITYDVLISCPSDMDQYVIYIKQAINNFNNDYGKEHHINLRTLYWKDDGFSESGGTPQALLNCQIVDNADMGVAVFWTRFGTKTQNYGSGSEEEIERMIASNKQMFIYFMNKEVSINELDLAELTKIKKFKKKYTNRGIYYSVSNETELEQKLKKDLEGYFRKRAIKKKI